MIIQEDDSQATMQIQRYEPGALWVNKKCYEHSVIIKPHSITPWDVQSCALLKVQDFESLFNPKVQIILLGTGAKLIVPESSLLRELFKKGIGVEFMDTRRACHTFTILAAEQRNVAACILII
ncbi:MAG: hypothetical protein JSR17_02605 [Proteobacteria bacterium]|nr:hypothetical protein [Pseudomonadota bacterium]